MPGVCIFPQAFNVGGPFSFQQKFSAGLKKRGIVVSDDPLDPDASSILVTGGTRHIMKLWRARQQGVRIVQRLDGLNWLHRRRYTDLRHFLRAEYGNFIQAFIRRWLSDLIVYQSEFARSWWERCYGSTQVWSTVVHNGVDLETFSPDGPHERPVDFWRILVVEGSMSGGYEGGLENAVHFVERLSALYQTEMMVVGSVSDRLRDSIQAQSRTPIVWKGLTAQDEIPYLLRSAHLLFSADIHPACPNSVIEAMACGLPVIAYDTGALTELVTPDAGGIVPYGGDAWRLDAPDTESLSTAAEEILSNLGLFQRGARKRAETAFDVDRMVDLYLGVLTGESKTIG